MRYESRNPSNGVLLRAFDFHDFPDLDVSLQAFKKWKRLEVEERDGYLQRLAGLLKSRQRQLAEIITTEMGKPIRESLYEVEKTLTLFDYYGRYASAYLEPKQVATPASKSYYIYEPLGIILCVMPWNFPFWQVFRFAVPALYAGNVIILKHAPNVPQCALEIEKLFSEAELPEGTLKNYFLKNETVLELIAHPAIAGLSFTGSDATGSFLAQQAGKYIKKTVLELGGNDAFIVLKDADLDYAVAGAIKSRSINAGQACNGAKRFIVVKEVADVFTHKLIEKVFQLKVGDPSDPETQIGPLARMDLLERVRSQVAESIRQGAVAHVSPVSLPKEGYYFAPMVLTRVKPGIIAFEEEIFGPVFSVVVAEDTAHAVQLANQSKYGLAASVWTNDVKAAEKLIGELECGNVFINDIVKSDTRLPFGGIKRSGYGRELSEAGLKEFVNIKTVFIK
ncbi:MAG: NAD-dependent succinate-semialdehyde dehydrogenase [Chitinophagales bacterium]|nr:NAD-dependent succinate-semialdehyde dehydrogenase [Chitinophagales bacterium]MDW8273385.1 NAD-dependent succinate-semialdehyde dehydrogenase [Chitinophagales bacterium]